MSDINEVEEEHGGGASRTWENGPSWICRYYTKVTIRLS